MTPFPSTLYHFADTAFSQPSSFPAYEKLEAQEHRVAWEDGKTLLKSTMNSCLSPVCLRANGREESNVNAKIQRTRKVNYNGERRKIRWPLPYHLGDESSGLEHLLVQIGQAGPM